MGKACLIENSKYCIRVVLRKNFNGNFCSIPPPPTCAACLSEGVKSAQASACTSNGGYYFFYLFLGDNSMN